MKDYELDLEKSKYFILNYEIVKNEIIINLGTGDKYPIPYTIENEKRILEQMKKQVENFNGTEFSKKQYIEMDRGIVSITTILILIATILFISPINMSIMTYAATMLVCVPIRTFFKIQLDKSNKILEDLKKNKKFIFNELELDTNIKNNPNCLSNTSKKAKEIISKNKSSEQKVTINTIDQISSEDLQKILDNIKLEKKLNIEHPELEQQKEEQKTLIKK